jgi:uncharacterized protein (TIGR03435 family)
LAEEACDTAVLSRGHDPRDYSEYLLDLARSVERAGARIEAVGMAMPGIGLTHRIRQILSGVPAPRISRPRMACTVAVCAAAAAIFAAGTLVRAQSPSTVSSARPEFEVVSIKPSPFTSSGAVAIGAQSTPGTVTLTGIRLRDLIARAYSLKPYQIVGPNRLDDDYYDIVAKSAQRVTDSDQRLMLQSMLAGRFELKAHTETKELPCYELVVRKGGLKIHPVVTDDIGPRYYPAPTAIRGKAISMARLADLLSTKTDRPVLDRTRVSGIFDIDLKWAADSDTEPGPSLFTAVQEQLGLKLESTHAPVEALVIDHVERPSEN